MTHALTEALLKRASQWEAFHEWERARVDALLTTDERVSWYAAAFDFVQDLPAPAMIRDMPAKVDQVRDMHERLKHLNRSDRDA
jgi:hypothetical protein